MLQKLTVILTCLIFPSILFCQELDVSKKYLFEKFRISKDEFDLEGIWLICNQNKNYFNSDTLWVYNHVNYFYHADNDCCEFVSWNFYSEDKYHLAKEWICVEPPYRTKYRFYDDYKIRLTDTSEGLLLTLKGFFKKNVFLIDRMEIVELWEGGNKSFRMRLIRK